LSELSLQGQSCQAALKQDALLEQADDLQQVRESFFGQFFNLNTRE
jgi:hypothetical protein